MVARCMQGCWALEALAEGPTSRLSSITVGAPRENIVRQATLHLTMCSCYSEWKVGEQRAVTLVDHIVCVLLLVIYRTRETQIGIMLGPIHLPNRGLVPHHLHVMRDLDAVCVHVVTATCALACSHSSSNMRLHVSTSNDLFLTFTGTDGSISLADTLLRASYVAHTISCRATCIVRKSRTSQCIAIIASIAILPRRSAFAAPPSPGPESTDALPQTN